MLSLTCKIAIKAVIYLASKVENGDKAGVKEVAEYIKASEHSMGKVLQTLVKEKIINSTKGPNGGFFIDDNQRGLPIVNIVVAIDGKDVFNQCGLGLSKCSADHPCPIHDDYKAVRDLFENLCSNKVINDLCDPVNNGIAYLFG